MKMKNLLKVGISFAAAALGVAAISTGTKVSAATTSSVLRNYNPNGDCDTALINGVATTLDDFVAKYNTIGTVTVNGKSMYTNTAYPFYRWTTEGSNNYVEFCGESPLVNWVDEDYLTTPGYHMVIGDEYGYLVYTRTTSVNSVIKGANYDNSAWSNMSSGDTFVNEILLFDIERSYNKESNYGSKSRYQYVYKIEVKLQTSLQTFKTSKILANENYWFNPYYCPSVAKVTNGDSITYVNNNKYVNNNVTYKGSDSLSTFGNYISIPVMDGSQYFTSNRLFIGNISSYLDIDGNGSLEFFNNPENKISGNNTKPLYGNINGSLYSYTTSSGWSFDYYDILTQSVNNAILDAATSDTLLDFAVSFLMDTALQAGIDHTSIDKNQITSTSAVVLRDTIYQMNDVSAYCTSESMSAAAIPSWLGQEKWGKTGNIPDSQNVVALSEPGDSMELTYNMYGNSSDAANPLFKHGISMTGGIHYGEFNLLGLKTGEKICSETFEEHTFYANITDYLTSEATIERSYNNGCMYIAYDSTFVSSTTGYYQVDFADFKGMNSIDLGNNEFNTKGQVYKKYYLKFTYKGTSPANSDSYSWFNRPEECTVTEEKNKRKGATFTRFRNVGLRGVFNKAYC